MAAKVFVTTASTVGSAAPRASESTALRDSPMGGSTASGFSTAMSAAARTPASPDNSGEAPAGSDAARAANVCARSTSGAATSGSTGSAAGADGTEQATSAAAMIAEADASTVDAGMATAQGKAADKTSGKARQASTDASNSVPTDAATLAMLLAASGMQIDGRAGSGQPSTDQPTLGQPTTVRPSGDGGGARTDDSGARQVAAAGTLAADVALAALTAPATISQASVQNSGVAAAGGSVKALTSTVLAPVSTNRSTQAVLDSLAASSAPDDQDPADSALLQDKSAAGDTLLAQPGIASASNGLPEMIRGLTPAPLQTAGVERTIAIPVTDRNWSEGLAAQVQWQVNNNVQSATLQLSPEHLGPLEVRIDVQPSQVNVSFTASHPDTRSALEQSVPRLREILANGGLTLGQASVQQEARSGSQYAPSVSRSSIGGSQNADPVPVSSIRTIGLIDEYA